METRWTYFDALQSGGFEFEMTLNDALSCCHSGSCDSDVEIALTVDYIKKQLAKLSDTEMRNAIEEYGVEDIHTFNRHRLEMYIVWLAAGNIVDDVYEEQRLLN